MSEAECQCVDVIVDLDGRTCERCGKPLMTRVLVAAPDESKVEEHRFGECCVEIKGDEVRLSPPRLDFSILMTPEQAHSLGRFLERRFRSSLGDPGFYKDEAQADAEE